MLPVKAKLLKKTKENGRVASLEFDAKMDAQPGQFVMAWLPGMDEKPMSISEVRPNLQITIANAGPCSKKITECKVGDVLFLRGPFGKGFESKGKRWLLVGGGYGFAPLRFMARKGMDEGKEVEAVLGARSREALLLAAKCKTHITTDDGSEGVKGNVIVMMDKLLSEKKFDCVYSCGPEKMMKAVAICAKKHGVESQLLIERYMKCGFGVCGHCAMGEFITCVDGPMMKGEDALENPEFGLFHKDRAGRKVDW